MFYIHSWNRNKTHVHFDVWLILSSLMSLLRRFYCLQLSWLHLILPLCGNKEIIESVLQKFKCRPFLRPLLPADHHVVIELHWTALRTRHPVQPVQALDHLRVGHPWSGRRRKRSFCEIWMHIKAAKISSELVSVQYNKMLCQFLYLGKEFVRRWLFLSGGSQKTRHLTWWWTCRSWWPLEPSIWWEI